MFKQILTRVVIDKEQMASLSRLSKQSPLLIMPNHRSYLDFMLVTWVLYSYDIKTPVIAAGQVIVGESVEREREDLVGV